MGEVKMELGMIGCGNMGRAILEGLLDEQVIASDKVIIAARQSALKTSQALGVHVGTPAEVLARSPVTILGIKPQQLYLASDWLNEACELNPQARYHTLISLLAGTSFQQLRVPFPSPIKLARVMPNLSVSVREGVTLFCAEHTDQHDDMKSLVMRFFAPLGHVEPLSKEDDLHAATAISGCGPAYLFQIIEAIADAGVHQGLPRATSLRLAAHTVRGSGALAAETHPAVLKDKVTSPGGVTIAGVRAMEKAGVRSAMIEAVIDAAARSRELEG